jgi:hypothetical protein
VPSPIATDASAVAAATDSTSPHANVASRIGSNGVLLVLLARR